MTESLRDFYPEIEPFATGFLPVSKVHSLYYEESGNVNGLPGRLMLVEKHAGETDHVQSCLSPWGPWWRHVSR